MTELPTVEGCEPLSTGDGPHGVLVLHGFTGCPQSMRPLAEAFAGAGFTVELPLLPGHGTTVEDMVATGWDDWSKAALAAYDELAGRCDRIVMAGLSLGGALTAWVATRRPEVAGIVCVNPMVRLDRGIADMARQMLVEGQDRLPAIGGDIADPEEREVAYEHAPLAPLLSFGEGLDGFRDDLSGITCPLLLMTSPEDHVVPPPNSDELAELVAGPVERISLDRSYHVATLDHDRETICTEAVAFAQRVTLDD